jgi:uncharacterized protein (TIGR00661 family)
MIGSSALKITKKPRILVAPLDWGLGHATRCIPVIYELMKQDCEIWLAGEGQQEILLKQEFPGLPFLPLKGYRTRYGKSRAGLFWSVFLRLPWLLKTVNYEHNWLIKMVNEWRFDAVISDNRFGLYHSSIPTVFITHQLRIKIPFGKWTEQLVQKINYRFINRFTVCWIPDVKNETGFAGDLSHPVIMPATPCQYIGTLSRLKRHTPTEKKGHLFISLSGPEPQRTLLENKIVSDIGHYNGTATIVRGLPGASSVIPSTNDLRFYNHLPAADYNKEIEKAEYIISRSGYSTIMDIVNLGKKSILIPTPGQPEQEYLATYLSEKKIALCMKQKDFSLQDILPKAKLFRYIFKDSPNNVTLQLLINSFIKSLLSENQKTKTAFPPL